VFVTFNRSRLKGRFFSHFEGLAVEPEIRKTQSFFRAVPVVIPIFPCFFRFMFSPVQPGIFQAVPGGYSVFSGFPVPLEPGAHPWSFQNFCRY